MPSAFRALLAAAFLGLCASPAFAQSIDGIVVVGAAKRAAQGATLLLLDRKQNPVDTAVADVFGAFNLQAPKAGRYFILVKRSGYYPILTERFELQKDETRTDSVYLTGPQADLSVRQVLERDIQRLFGSSVGAAFTRYVGPEQMDTLRTQATHLGDIVMRGRLLGLQYLNPPNGCLRFSGESGCAQIYLDGIPAFIRPEQVSSYDIEAVIALRSMEVGIAAQTRSYMDNSRFGAVLVYTSRFASR